MVRELRNGWAALAAHLRPVRSPADAPRETALPPRPAVTRFFEEYPPPPGAMSSPGPVRFAALCLLDATKQVRSDV